MIKWLVCFIYGHNLNTKDVARYARDSITYAIANRCTRCNKYIEVA